MTRRSTTVYCVFLGSNPLSFPRKKQAFNKKASTGFIKLQKHLPFDIFTRAETIDSPSGIESELIAISLSLGLFRSEWDSERIETLSFTAF
jgi:DNA repair exonuclease SbcCD ATPase subunit